MQEENKPADRDLIAELNQATEPKTPSADNIKSWTWEEKEPGGDEPGAPPTQPEKPGTAPVKGKLSPEQIKQSAIASAAGVELITSLTSEGIINLKYYYKFKEDERARLDEKLLDMNPEKLNEEEAQLVNRYNRLMNQRDKKIEKVSMSEKARKRMEDAFASYTEATGQTFLTPKTQLGLAVGESVIKSIIASFLD